jgi:hypothetical protein
VVLGEGGGADGDVGAPVEELCSARRDAGNGTKSRNHAYTEAVGDALAWMRSDAYLALAARSIEERVRKPLLARGIPLSG